MSPSEGPADVGSPHFRRAALFHAAPSVFLGMFVLKVLKFGLRFGFPDLGVAPPRLPGFSLLVLAKRNLRRPG